MSDGDTLAQSPIFGGEKSVQDAFRRDTVDDSAEFAEGKPSPVVTVRQKPATAYEAFTVTLFPSTGAGRVAPLLLVGEDRQRAKLTVMNVSAADGVVLGHLAQVQNGQGFLLPVNIPVTLETTEPIFAASADGVAANTQLSVFVERNDA